MVKCVLSYINTQLRVSVPFVTVVRVLYKNTVTEFECMIEHFYQCPSVGSLRKCEYSSTHGYGTCKIPRERLCFISCLWGRASS